MEGGGPDDRERQADAPRARREAAAAQLGASFKCLDLGDYPLQIDGEELLLIADTIREFAPDVLVTHTDTDPFNPDHPVAYAAVDRARSLAAGAGVQSAFATITPPALFLFEPHQPELCNFTPNTFVDITAVIEQKRAAMAEMKAQRYLQTYYDQRAAQRGNHARRGSATADVEFAEAFQRMIPQVVANCERAIARRARAAWARRRCTRPAAGAATSMLDLHQIVPGSRVAGPGADRPLRPGRQPDGARGDGALRRAMSSC